MNQKKPIRFAFFGTSKFSVIVLSELETAGFIPSIIITREDKPVGRNQTLTPPPAKVWAKDRGVEVLQPKTLKDPAVYSKLLATDNDLFIVASYGKIIPKNILDLPKFQTLNVHPSLLPKLRGPSPVQSAILYENETGVSIMRLDEELDHGPIVAQQKINIPLWPPYEHELEEILARAGGKLLAEIMPDWIEGKITEKEQDHHNATYSVLIKKNDAEINLSDSPETNLRKIRGFAGWPNAWTKFQSKNGDLRVVIKEARIENRELIIERVTPEGRKEMTFEEFKHGFLA